MRDPPAFSPAAWSFTPISAESAATGWSWGVCSNGMLLPHSIAVSNVEDSQQNDSALQWAQGFDRARGELATPALSGLQGLPFEQVFTSKNWLFRIFRRVPHAA